MRLNKFIALSTGIARRSADQAIADGRVLVNKIQPQIGMDISDSDEVTFDSHVLKLPAEKIIILLNKPVGFVCSRQGQGSRTIYELLPRKLYHLKPVGRLDKDSSGLLLLTDDGDLAHKLTHPSFQKSKVYEIMLDKPLQKSDIRAIETGISLHDGISKLKIEQINQKDTPKEKKHISSGQEGPDGTGILRESNKWRITMSEGRNRQIRRTFKALGYEVTKLHRTKFGQYSIGKINSGDYELTKEKLR